MPLPLNPPRPPRLYTLIMMCISVLLLCDFVMGCFFSFLGGLFAAVSGYCPDRACCHELCRWRFVLCSISAQDDALATYGFCCWWWWGCRRGWHKCANLRSVTDCFFGLREPRGCCAIGSWERQVGFSVRQHRGTNCAVSMSFRATVTATPPPQRTVQTLKGGMPHLRLHVASAQSLSAGGGGCSEDDD